MSKLVKERKAAQRKEITLNKTVDAITKMKQAQAKNDPIEKARQAYMMSLTTRSLGNY